MKNRMLSVLAGGLLIGAFAAANAELPPLSQEQQAAAAAKADKANADKAKAAKALANAQERAVANYRKQQGANHATARSPDAELTRQEAQTKMPKPGQANDHSTTARDPR